MTTSTCEYKFRSGEKCGEDVYETPPYRIRRVYIENGKERYSEEKYKHPPYCILHLEFPIEDDNPSLYNDIKRDKQRKVKEKKYPKNRYFNFEGAKIESIDLHERKDIGVLNFVGATIKGDVFCEGATIEGGAVFTDAVIGGGARFMNATIKDAAWFERAVIGGGAWFTNATIEGLASFQRAVIKMPEPSIIKEGVCADFSGAAIKGDIWFDQVRMEGGFECHSAEIAGKLSFELAQFKRIDAQEEAYRKAKQTWEHVGDRKRSDDYFYKEMVAKRKRKSKVVRYLEYIPAQVIFGYGVHPERLFGFFFLSFFVFALVYSALEGVTGEVIYNNARFSFLTLFVPGSYLQNPKPWPVGILTVIEAIFGLLTWGTLIATLTRKFGR
jgi:hypothetical protein